MKRVLGVLAGLLAALAAAAPAAAALHPPELFVRLQPWDTHEAAGDWIPLASAPALDYLAGYQIGYRLQDSGQPHQFQVVALTIAGVPDGAPTQPVAGAPYCVGRAGTPGEIVEAGPEIQFEGDGTYTVRVSVGTDNADPQQCLTGPTTTATFTVTTRVTPSLEGEPLSFRAAPLPHGAFVGVRAPDPPGGLGDVRCALDAIVRPDGSVTGAVTAPDPSLALRSVPEEEFTRPGRWTCVARGFAEGLDDAMDRLDFATPWSAPLGFDVRSDFRRRTGAVTHPRARRSRFTFKAEWPALAAGGQGKVAISRVRGCKRHGYKLRRFATVRGTFGAKRLRVRVARPRRPGYFLGRLSFSGTRFLRAGTDPNPILLVAVRGRFGFADPRAFPPCRP